jgi:hypothetical protein
MKIVVGPMNILEVVLNAVPFNEGALTWRYDVLNMRCQPVCLYFGHFLATLCIKLLGR